MKKIFFLIIISIFFSQKNFAQEVTIPNSQIKRFTSSIIPGQEYELQIMLPAGYDANKKQFPVLYLLDSQWDFPLVTALYGQQYYDGFIPDMIIVGITWGGTHPNPDSLRVRDYTPTNDKRQLQSGGADQFLSVLKTEIFPFVEKNYRANKNDRTLMGCSLGGLFTLYTLFTQPQLFQRYVAASPAFMWDNSVIYQFEKKYFENKNNPSAKLFMCVGAVERSVPDFQKLTKHLSDRSYKTLQIKSEVLENTGHSGTKGIGFEKGLQYVFERPSIKLSAAQLQKHIGIYQLPDGSTAEIKSENGTPVIYFGNNKYSLNASTGNEFYATSEFLNLHFKTDDEGNVSGFQMDKYGSTQFVKKIK